MIIPKSTDFLSLKNATVGALVVLGSSGTCRRPTACSRELSGPPYTLPDATPLNPTCPVIWNPIGPISLITATFGIWTYIGSCFVQTATSQNAAPISSFPTSQALPFSSTSPCYFASQLTPAFTQNDYNNATCGGTPSSTAPQHFNIAVDFTNALIRIWDGFSDVDIFNAPLSPSPFDLTATPWTVIGPNLSQATFTNTIPSDDPYTAWLDALTLTAAW